MLKHRYILLISRSQRSVKIITVRLNQGSSLLLQFPQKVNPSKNLRTTRSTHDGINTNFI